MNKNAPTLAKIKEEEQREAAKAEMEVRGKLTNRFILGFFMLIVGSCIFVLCYNAYAIGWIESLNSKGMTEAANKVSLLELDKVLSIIISALGTSLGFIIGYYFKDKK